MINMTACTQSSFGFKAHCSQKVVASNPAPVLSSISPNPAAGSNSQQTFTLSGSGFLSGAIVEWNDLTVGDSETKALFSLSPNTILVSLNVTNNMAIWRLRVRNPNGQASGWVNFHVVAQ